MVEPAPEELSALLPCLDEIYESLNSVDTQNEIDTTRGSSQNEASPKKHKVRRRTADSLPYSTAAQRRKKEELCALRLEAQRLSVKLAHLVQKESAGNKANAEHEELKWRGRAIIECGNRVSSEQTNQKLKAILLQQFKVFQSARKLLGKSGVLEGVEFVERLHPMADRALFHLDISDRIVSELSCDLGRLCLQLRYRTRQTFYGAVFPTGTMTQRRRHLHLLEREILNIAKKLAKIAALHLI
ncbi:uncharacterized protein IUM83_17544 [Phytophthora cinnamomi]|uniref:uncharacterized protein n=1 Tax=Phytophthora cinnamomi TaxID=4785 RepID=UPI0035595195|nr:hypothetical protein IUM83_17544 [Phytophthora cinnamomi]